MQFPQVSDTVEGESGSDDLLVSRMPPNAREAILMVQTHLLSWVRRRTGPFTSYHRRPSLSRLSKRFV